MIFGVSCHVDAFLKNEVATFAHLGATRFAKIELFLASRRAKTFRDFKKQIRDGKKKKTEMDVHFKKHKNRRSSI